MTRVEGFESAIGSEIQNYVAWKKALGCKAETLRHRLSRLDRFLAEQGAEDLNEEAFDSWLVSLKHLAASTRRQTLQTVYLFCTFRRRSNPSCFVPDRSLFPPAQPRPIPRILACEEISRLLLATDTLLPGAPSPLQRQVGRVALALFYTAGLRLGEVVRLTLGDYDPSERTLLIRESKFHKSRLLPLSNDAVEELHRYLRDRQRPEFPSTSDSPLLLNRHGGPSGYTCPGLGRLIRRLYRRAEVRGPDGSYPRVHDLRFTFAVHALLRWYHAGVDVQARLPALSIYMGHVSIVSTQYYLSFLDDVAAVAGERFKDHCSKFLFRQSRGKGEL